MYTIQDLRLAAISTEEISDAHLERFLALIEISSEEELSVAARLLQHYRPRLALKFEMRFRIKKGVWQHFAGSDKLYLTLEDVIDTERDCMGVMYIPLYGEYADREKRKVLPAMVRSRKNFLETVDRPKFNYKGPRFRYIGPHTEE